MTELPRKLAVVLFNLGGPDRPAGIALMWTSTDPAVPQRLALVLDHLQKG